MYRPKFVCVVYIATTAEKLWAALTQPEFTRKYWAGCWQRSDWRAGSSWELMTPDGRVGDSGEIVEIERPNRLVVTWRNHLSEEFNAIGFTRATFNVEPSGAVMKLTVTHEAPENGEAFVDAVSQGWPSILSSLKSLLETGNALPGTDKWPEGV